MMPIIYHLGKQTVWGVFMSRFKHLWLSFWRKDQGLGMIETAITLPLFLIITFGVIEFGNMFIARYQARDVANSVADYLKSKPSATSNDLQNFVTNLGFGTLKNTKSGGENNIFTKIKIKSEKTMKTAAQFDALCAGGAVKDLSNPWLSDGDANNDNNPYYIHVCYPYTYNNITPLSTLTADALPRTKTFNNKALAYIGQDSTDNGNFGGMFSVQYLFTSPSACAVGNPFTAGTCACPSWAPNIAPVGYVPMPVVGVSYLIQYCYKGPGSVNIGAAPVPVTDNGDGTPTDSRDTLSLSCDSGKTLVGIDNNQPVCKTQRISSKVVPVAVSRRINELKRGGFSDEWILDSLSREYCPGGFLTFGTIDVDFGYNPGAYDNRSFRAPSASPQEVICNKITLE